MSTIKVDTIATRTGSGNITVSNNIAGAGTISGTNITASGTLGVTGNTTVGGTLGITGATTLTGEATLNGNLNISASSFDNAGAHLKVGGQLRPQVNFRSTWGSYTQSFTGSDVSNYTDTTGRQAHPAFNGVYGQNTTGAVTSSTPGQCYYKIPYTGIYFMSFAYLVNAQTSSHVDATFNIQSANSFANSATAYVGPSGGAFGTQFEGLASYTDFTNTGNLARGNQTIGFARWHADDSMAGSIGVSICNFFQKNMVIRPQICMNTTASIQIYGVNHSHWSILYLGR